MDGKLIRSPLKWEVIPFEGEDMVRCTFPDGESVWGSFDGAATECDILRALIDARRAERGHVVDFNPR